MLCYYICWDLSLIHGSLLRMLVLKSLILSVKFGSIFENSKELREYNMYFTKSTI